MHICTTEPQNLITLFPVQPQMVCHLMQVKKAASELLSEVEPSTTETSQKSPSPASCSKRELTLVPVQVAQDSLPVKFSKPSRTDTSELLWVAQSAFSYPQTENYFACTQVEALISHLWPLYFHSALQWQEETVKSPHSHLIPRLKQPPLDTPC